VTATEAVAGDTGGAYAAIYVAAVPSGTSVTIELVLDAVIVSATHIGWYTVDMAANIVRDFDSQPLTLGTAEVTIDIPASGFSIVVEALADTSDRAHSINASFTEDAEPFASRNSAYSHREVVSAAPSEGVTATWASSSSDGHILVASWDGKAV
jgi:hypothetical protein